MHDMTRRFCINLDRRPDRWERFQRVCPFDDVERWPAVDGQTIEVPESWTKRMHSKRANGAYGCYLSHMMLIAHCVQMNYPQVMIFEDDAVPALDFMPKYEQFIAELPAWWDMVYLGGELLQRQENKPIRVSDNVYRAFNVNRLHAYMLTSSMMRRLGTWLKDGEHWKDRMHVDHHIMQLHRQFYVFIPRAWLFGQTNGLSDISGFKNRERFWRWRNLGQSGSAGSARPQKEKGRTASGSLPSGGFPDGLGRQGT